MISGFERFRVDTHNIRFRAAESEIMVYTNTERNGLWEKKDQA